MSSVADKKGRYDSSVAEVEMRTIRKIAFGYAALFLGVYSLDYVPGVMDANGKMFGLFSMTPLVDAGHLALGALALICGLISARAARFYFWLLGIAYGLDVMTYAVSHWGKISPTTNFLVNLPHTLIFISAFIVARKVDRAQRVRRHPVRRSLRWLTWMAVSLIVLSACMAGVFVLHCSPVETGLVPSPPTLAGKDIPGYSRPEDDSFLEWAEWYIVWSYQEKATWQRTRLPSGFPYTVFGP